MAYNPACLRYTFSKIETLPFFNVVPLSRENNVWGPDPLSQTIVLNTFSIALPHQDHPLSQQCHQHKL